MSLAYRDVATQAKKSRKRAPDAGASPTVDLLRRSSDGPGSVAESAPTVVEELALPSRLHQFFERQCDAHSEALALIVGDERYTYAALEALANQLARHLASLGVGPQGRVGILLERSVQTYVALLAVLKCGAAFVPIDPSFPAERIAYIAEDAALNLLLTTSGFAQVTATLACPVLPVDTAGDTIAQQSPARLVRPDTEDALCYIIYTSGSTGHPKGVAINQSSICNFIAVCTPIYGVTARDRVYQGMTIAFDFSIEEIWPTFASGATLVAGPTDHRRLGPGLVEFLTEQQVTMLYCVPTLLATLDHDIASLRTLNVGGEACPHDLVKLWSRAGRRMLNTYGPTEATVTATWTELLPDRAVTIGKPLPTYRVYLLDDKLSPVPPGEHGEICLGGLGVAVGYVNRPELTAEKFVAASFPGSRRGERIYRTGDLGRLTDRGEIEYLGRVDTQVKIRGYRIELSEIEAVLREDPDVEHAVVSVLSEQGVVQDLVAYVARCGSEVTCTGTVDELKTRWHAALCQRLPRYMVPAFIEILPAFPTLASGKTDRSRLPKPVTARLSAGSSEYVTPVTALEREVAAIWASVFQQTELSVAADFFQDLGGHSLFAALAISRMRQNPRMRHVSIADLYQHPTIRGLARFVEQTAASPPLGAEDQVATAPRLPARWQPGNLRVLACGVGQLALIYLLFTCLGWPLLIPLVGAVPGSWALLGLAVAVMAPTLLATSLSMPIVLKWLLIGRLRAGRYPLWGWTYCRWWLMRKLLLVAPVDLLAGSPLLPIYARLLGARVGRGCHLGSGRLDVPDLIEIGDRVCLGYGTALQTHFVENGWLVLSPIRIEADAFVGANAVVMPGSRLGRGARLCEQSLLPREQVLSEGETWAGSPAARLAGGVPLLEEMAASQGPQQRWSWPLWSGFVVGYLVLALLPVLLLVPGLALELAAVRYGLLAAVAAAPLAGALFVLATCVCVALGKRLVMPVVKPGIFPVHSSFGLRKWLVDKLIDSSLTMTNTLYATLYVVPWLRLLGAKVGPRSEVSTVSHFDPDLLDLGPESFVADMAVIGAATYFNGFVALGRTQLGRRCFVGNSALVSSGRRLGDGSLIGVQSVPPAGPVEAGTSWLGSPAIFLPRRQLSEKFDEQVTFRPPTRLLLCRLAIEFWRVVLPSTVTYWAIAGGAVAWRQLLATHSVPVLLGLMPLFYLAFALLATGFVAVLKWSLVGRYRPRVEPLWSHFVWRTELITGLYENVAVPALLRWLTGTPWVAPALRLLGVNIGRRVYLDSTFMTEFDLVFIGDDVQVGGFTSLQTHLFEDRVMKMSTVHIGAACTVGQRSVVLYDSQLSPGAELDALSLVMKGETLPPDSRWRGIPARLVE